MSKLALVHYGDKGDVWEYPLHRIRDGVWGFDSSPTDELQLKMSVVYDKTSFEEGNSDEHRQG